ncbi:MAG: M1 family metallopeptidase [Pyrinomonadaceae bacterium]
MKLSIRFFAFNQAAVILIAVFSAFGQTARPDLNRSQTYDVQHYVIRTSFDPTAKRVMGDTTVSLKPLNPNFKVVELDAVDLTFTSVALDPSGTRLDHRSTAGKVIVTLDRAYSPDELISIRFRYTATPKKGVYFVPAEEGPQGRGHSAQIWTQGEPDEARHWFPSFDFPSDKATTEQYLTVQKDETVVGNGELVGRQEQSDGTVTWHYKMPVPHSTYLTSFVIGKYSRAEDKYKDIPLGFYVYPGMERVVPKAFGETKDMMRVFEEQTGVAFPYNKYDQTIVALFQFGGMENISATTMADNEIFLAEFDFGRGPIRDLVSHELAHSWFGNLVTCRNWAELWLNEGFATFMEAVYVEKTAGRGEYLTKIRSDAAEFLVDDSINKRRHALYNVRAVDVSSLFLNASTTYHKGGAVIHTLREEVGDGPFWKAINIYLNRHKFANVESTDLRKAMEEASGKDLKWFFDQWVYGAGAPRLDIRQVYNRRAKKLTITVSQTHRIDPITPAVFRLPMDVTIKGTGEQADHVLDISKRVQTFTLDFPVRPASLEIDPKERIPLKQVKLRPLVSLR